MTFVPLSAISPDAQAVQEKYLAPIRTRINSGDYAPGLLKQYKLQLENIKAQIPGLEVLIFPSIGLSLRKRDIWGDKAISTHVQQKPPTQRGNMQVCCVC
jgi:hypothetical protein